MSGHLTSIYAVALAIQADAETRATLDSGDLFPAANLRMGGETFTQDNPESTGSVHRPGPAVLGRAASDSFDVIMRGPGGSNVPNADEYVPGRVLRAAGFAEISESTGIASETLGGASSNAGTTTTVILGTSASSTDGAYVGYVIQFSDIGGGSGAGSTSQIIAYNGTTKVATLGEKLATLPAASYSIPDQLVYRLDKDAAQLFLTYDIHLHKKRHKRQHAPVSQLQITLPTTNRGDAQLAVMSATLAGQIDDSDDETDTQTPAVPAGGAIPPFRDGRLALNGVNIGGASVVYDHGIQVGYPPNPNKSGGNHAGCIVETRRSCQLNLNEVLLSEQDRNALAAAQAYVPLMLRYGTAAGKSVYFCVPAGRLDYSIPDTGGQFVTTSPTLYIDGAEKAVCISFPYYT